MGAEFSRRSGGQSRISQWLRRRPKGSRWGAPPLPGGLGAGEDIRREALLLAAAGAGLPLAPAAHPCGYRCSCERVGCPTPARHPMSVAWQTQSTTDLAQIRNWAEKYPLANFVTATGRVHDVLDVPAEVGRAALDRLLASGIEVGPVAESGDGRMLFFTLTRGTPEDEDEWWACELDCRPETMDEHPGLRWHCRASYVLVPPARLPDDLSVVWVRGPEHPLPEPLSLLEVLTDAAGRLSDEKQSVGRAPRRRDAQGAGGAS